MPPSSVADPAFTEVAPQTDVYVDGYHTVEMARIDVTTTGVYRIGAKNPTRSGGAISIAAPPVVISQRQNAFRAWPLIGLLLGLGVATFVWQGARSGRQ